MNKEQIQSIADAFNLGEVIFEFRTAKNTGKDFEAGYIDEAGLNVLFCKRGSSTTSEDFYLCNEFRELEAKQKEMIQDKESDEDFIRRVVKVLSDGLSIKDMERLNEMANCRMGLLIGDKFNEELKRRKA